MGESIPSTARLSQPQVPQTTSSPSTTATTSRKKPVARRTFAPSPANPKRPRLLNTAAEMETESSSIKDGDRRRVPLSEVVSDCVQRWFKDALKEAKAGDINMQVLVGQMFNNGYGVPRDTKTGKTWITRASKTRSSVWKYCEKQPGYNASDSDSEEVKGDS